MHREMEMADNRAPDWNQRKPTPPFLQWLLLVLGLASLAYLFSML
jgi:hypothetical protein